MSAERTAVTLGKVPVPITRDWRIALELLLLGAIWGGSFLFMRIAAKPFGAFALVDIRLALGALVMLPFLWRDRAAFQLGMWPKLALIGLINSAIPFLLFAWAAQRAPAAVGAICNAMTVLFAALVAFLFFGEKIGARRALALLVGFAGVVLLATSKVAGLSVGWAVVAGAAASMLYGVGLNVVRRHMAHLPPAASAGSTLGCSALLLAPFAATHWPAATIPASAWFSAVALGVLCTGFAFLMYYRLIQRIGPTRTAVVTYLVPLFGAAFAWWFLAEPVTPSMIAAGLLILGSVAVSQRASNK
ncbi:MAG: DMT family transporter [Pseudoxanthomonas sp.]